MPDEIDKLAVGVAEDHRASKRRTKAAKAGDEARDEALDAGSPQDEADALATVIEGKVAEAGEDEGSLSDAVDSLGAAIDARDADEDRATDFMVDRLIRIAQESEFERGTLVGDVRDTLLDLFKANPRPWDTLKEDQQRAIAGGLETAAKVLIRAVVLVVAEDGEGGNTIHAKLESYAEKGGLKIALTANGDRDTVLALHDAVGQQVVVRRADATRYDGQRRPPAVDPDQPDLQFEGDTDRPVADAFDPPAGDEDLADGFDDDQDPPPADEGTAAPVAEDTAE